MRRLAALALVAAACAHDPDPGASDLGAGDAIVMAPLDSGCATASAAAKLVPVSLILMIDKSGSMGDGVNGDPALKWNPITAAIKQFVGDPDSAGVSASLHFFPQADLCNPSAYYTPAVALRALPDAAPFSAAIDAQTPAGNTPTRPVVLGAIDYALDAQAARPGERVAIVLVTDGEPDSCNSSVENVAFEVGRVASTIPTFVVGVGQSVAMLNKIAQAGGTGQAVLVSTGDPAQTTADFLATLESIRGLVVPCSFLLPTPPDGMALDTMRVNVVYTTGAGAANALTYARDCTAGAGWRYDNESAPTRVELCPQTCADAKRDRAARIDVVFGCYTLGDLIL
jgi:hypothetical protein